MLLALNNATSFVIVVVCWWLCHSYAQQKERLISVGFAMTGLIVLTTMISRNVAFITYDWVQWQIVGTKVTISIALIGLLIRRSRSEMRVAKMMDEKCPADLPHPREIARRIFGAR